MSSKHPSGWSQCYQDRRSQDGGGVRGCLWIHARWPQLGINVGSAARSAPKKPHVAGLKERESRLPEWHEWSWHSKDLPTQMRLWKVFPASKRLLLKWSVQPSCHDQTPFGYQFLSPMLRVQWLSGEEITSIDPSILGSGNGWVLSLKQHLQRLTGFSRFRQRLLRGSIQLEDAEIVDATDVFTLQLVILPLVQEHLEELFQRTRDDDVQGLEVLLQQRVDPNLVQDSHTALHLAVKAGSSRCCSLLIEAAAQLHSDFDQLSPLHLAAQEDHLEVLQMLLHAGADPDQPLSTGATPLFLAASMAHLDIVGCLVEAAANVNIPTLQGSTALFTASRQGQIEICRLLLKARADMEHAIKSNGSTPLIMASARNDLEIVRLLIEAKAKKDTACNDGATALFVACEGNHLETVRLLVHSGADKEKALETGKTPLMVAAERGHLQTLCFLMKAGANIQQGTTEGRTALDFATNLGHSKIVQELRAAAGNLDGKLGVRWGCWAKANHLQFTSGYMWLLLLCNAGNIGILCVIMTIPPVQMTGPKNCQLGILDDIKPLRIHSLRTFQRFVG